ncbi:hypothetical protein NE237_007464 [Protea cynaroides]|uniref:Single-stranded DNA binding protein Ssb-like OB fold domain-containing protein n=1 Tax=Protea cynaroides TaxID=273540 RepID=A0A9Q0QW51_9MAGN|nr:hypothetical protein NE237_007464 [Protea cynaroides]
MFWSRISRKIDLLPSLKSLRAVPFESSQARGVLQSAAFNERTVHRYHRLAAFNERTVHGYRRSLDSQFNVTSTSRNFEASSALIGFRRLYVTQTATERKSKKILISLTALVFAMVGATYAAVPLYRRFCQATGYGGTVHRSESVEEKIARHTKDGTAPTREIVVQFNADVADGMQWKFIPTQREVRVKPGESALAFYLAENRSSTPITGVSTYNVTPMKAAIYFNKIQCFCFEEQRLLPGEQIDMPVFFYIDPEFETDPKMDGINNIILSYTFFKAGLFIERVKYEFEKLRIAFQTLKMYGRELVEQAVEQAKKLDLVFIGSNGSANNNKEEACIHDCRSTKPGTIDYTLLVKILSSNTVLQKGWAASQHLCGKCLVCDDSGTIIFIARNEQVDTMKAGACVGLRRVRKLRGTIPGSGWVVKDVGWPATKFVDDADDGVTRDVEESITFKEERENV